MDSFAWQAFSYSGANADCVEARAVDGLVELRESDDGNIIVRTPSSSPSSSRASRPASSTTSPPTT
ncbi:DUF397 domain-containing protein [Kitasatospora sp. NPDC001603]|uniref:DUF397 domain-containing protein n=1 Tax=Kitasatospora sp. NPDC001603 TaxID=3154388 RepID=UPI003330C425